MSSPDRDPSPLRIPGQRRKTTSSPFSPVDATSWGIHSVPGMLSDFKRHTSHGNTLTTIPLDTPTGSVAGSRVASGVGLNLMGVNNMANGTYQLNDITISDHPSMVAKKLSLTSLSGSIPAFISLPTGLLTISYITMSQKDDSRTLASNLVVVSLITGLLMLLAGLVSLLEKRTSVISTSSISKRRKSTISLVIGVFCLLLSCTWLGAARVTVAVMAGVNVGGVGWRNFKQIRPFILFIFVLFMYDVGYYSGDPNHPFLVILLGYLTLMYASYSITRNDLDISRSISLGSSVVFLLPALFTSIVAIDTFVLTFITSGAIGVFLLAKRNIIPTRLNGLIGALIIVGISTFINELPHSQWDIVLAIATIFIPVRAVAGTDVEEQEKIDTDDDSQAKFKTWGILDSILAHDDTRNIFYFLLLNFSFMLIQLLYSVLSHSLGLLSDSIHMFFDCLALLVGLVASILSKFPPSSRFPYGLGKVETVSGFTNGCLLIAISGGVIAEALERMSHPIELEKTSELLVVSVLGLLVNLVGIFAFNHGHAHGHDHGHGHEVHDHSHEVHDHSHEGHDHSHEGHDHSHEGHNHSHEGHHEGHHTHDDTHTHAPSHPHSHSHSHSHSSHSHSHENENMRGIFLHIMADTLGSVGVIISTILTNITGWSGFDPIASIFIAVLIFFSAIPLVTGSAKTLMLSLGDSKEYQLRDILNDISITNGVSSYSVPKFWQDGAKVRGVLHVQYQKGANSTIVRDKVAAKLKENGIEDVFIQVEEEGSPCWCKPL